MANLKKRSRATEKAGKRYLYVIRTTMTEQYGNITRGQEAGDWHRHEDRHFPIFDLCLVFGLCALDYVFVLLLAWTDLLLLISVLLLCFR